RKEELRKIREETEKIWDMLPAAMEVAKERIKVREEIKERMDKLLEASLGLFPCLRKKYEKELLALAEAAKAHEGDKGNEGHGRDQDQEIADSQEQEQEPI
ncbi:hypothetical protein PC116_g34953, partial [Phytophthora cactorum]